MAISELTSGSRRQRHEACNDPVVGAILSGWRYDISGISPAMRGDYEEHLAGCSHCLRRQRIHRTVDFLLLFAMMLSFAAFLLAALVINRLEVITHISAVHVHLPQSAIETRWPSSIAISLQAVAIVGMVVSMLATVLVAIATPIPSVVTGFVRERVFKHAA